MGRGARRALAGPTGRRRRWRLTPLGPCARRRPWSPRPSCRTLGAGRFTKSVNPFLPDLRQGCVFIVVLPILLGGGYLAFTRRGRRGSRARTPFIVGGSLLVVLLVL